MPENKYVREYLQYGGQAIIEGVMMRSPHFFAISCRAPNGQIVSVTERIAGTWAGKLRWMKVPFLRGSLAILDSMALGGRAMRFAANVQLDPALAAGQEKAQEEERRPNSTIQDIGIGSTLLVGIALGVLLFMVAPNTLVEYATRGRGVSPTLKNLSVEIIKVIFFFTYMWAIGKSEGIRQVFCYHGAEHKSINTLEALQPLEIDHCKAQTRLHPRCGTSFAVIVLLLSMMFMTFVPRYPIPGQGTVVNIIIRVLVELAFLPFVAGAGYELIRIAGKFRGQATLMLLFKPGLWTQLLTTREPEESQIEVALTALKLVVAAEDEYVAQGKKTEGPKVPYDPRPEEPIENQTTQTSA